MSGFNRDGSNAGTTPPGGMCQPAAIISDPSMDWRHGKTLFIIGRSAGLAAQASEKIITGKPLQFAAPTPLEYIGPENRDIKRGQDAS